MLETLAVIPLGWPALLTIAVTAAVFLVLALDRAPADLTLLGAVLLLTMTGVISLKEAFSGFANEAVLTVGALFIVAAAVRNTGALSYVYDLMTPRGPSVTAAVLRTSLPAATLSSVMNNTPIVAILTPAVQERCRAAGIAPSKLLIPLAYATTLGGVTTLIGTSTNLVVSGLLAQEGHAPLRMFELTWAGLPVAIAGLLYMLVAAHRLLPNRDSDPPFDRNEVRAYHFELRIPADSPLKGRTVEQAGLRALKGAFLAHIHRGGELISLIAPDQLLHGGDVLAFVGNPQHLEHLLLQKKLTRAVDHTASPGAWPLQLFEAVVAHDSTMIGKDLREFGFRTRFEGVVLGVRRRGQQLTSPLGRTAIEPGDLLLIEARASFEPIAWASSEFSLVAPLERPQTRVPRKAPMTLAILIAMAALMGSGFVAVPIAAFLGAIAIVASGAISAQDARRSIDLSVLVTIASSFGIARALESTGVAEMIANVIVRPMEAWGPIAVLVAIYAATNALSEVLSNNAAAALVFPVAAAAAKAVGADLLPFAIAVAIAASAAFASPLGYQTYLMVMGPGSYRFRDFVRIGLPLNLLAMVVAIMAIVARWM
ncbi:MAG TPA: SLC13 family permease [Thermoanaerobaculia bacterium]|jgi:di/tricarboxylate transporter